MDAALGRLPLPAPEELRGNLTRSCDEQFIPVHIGIFQDSSEGLVILGIQKMTITTEEDGATDQGRFRYHVSIVLLLMRQDSLNPKF